MTSNCYGQQPSGPAGSISSSSYPCMNGSDVFITYTVAPIANATQYIWSFSSGVIPMSPPGNTIQLKFPANISQSSITLSVYGGNSYGTGATSSITINIYQKPAAAGPISGPAAVCPGQNSVVLSVAPITNANPHIWVFPTGVTPVGSPTSSTVTVNFSSSFTGGEFRVFGVNGPCGSSAASTLQVSVASLPATPSAISGSQQVCMGQSGVVYSVPTYYCKCRLCMECSPGRNNNFWTEY